MASVTRKRTSTPAAGTAPNPRVVKRARRNSYRVKKPGDTGTRHNGPATIRLANTVLTSTAA